MFHRAGQDLLGAGEIVHGEHDRTRPLIWCSAGTGLFSHGELAARRHRSAPAAGLAVFERQRQTAVDFVTSRVWPRLLERSLQ